MLSIGEITAREHIYQFLTSMLLKEPTPELIQGLVDTLPYLKEIFAEEVSFDEWDQIIQNYQNGVKTIEELQQDFYDLFFVPTSGRYSPAVESIVIYNKMWGEIEVELANRYEAAQFVPENLDIYTPFKQLGMSDLFGYQLGYMAHLCGMETYSFMDVRGKIQEEELGMLEQHLIPFIAKYRESFDLDAQGTIYRVLIELIQQFIEMDRELILNSGVISYA
ncbi:MAG: molecular chaperone [Tepidibacillus sp.]